MSKRADTTSKANAALNRFATPTVINRRRCLQLAACGFGSLALQGMLSAEHAAAREQEQALQPHHPPTAKRVIFIFMQGGPSHVDTWDPKPMLTQRDGDKADFLVARTRQVSAERIFKSPWRFQQYGECGQPVSELFPEMARHVDKMCFLKGMHTEGVAHGPATLFLHTGATNLIRPSVGSWINYGLGTENEDLPGL